LLKIASARAPISAKCRGAEPVSSSRRPAPTKSSTPRLPRWSWDGAGALLVAADPYFDTRRDRIVAFAVQHRLRGERYPAMIRPAVMGHHEMVELGAGVGPVFIEFACPALRQAPRPAAKQNDGPGLVICLELVGRLR